MVQPTHGLVQKTQKILFLRRPAEKQLRENFEDRAEKTIRGAERWNSFLKVKPRWSPVPYRASAWPSPKRLAGPAPASPCMGWPIPIRRQRPARKLKPPAHHRPVFLRRTCA